MKRIGLISDTHGYLDETNILFFLSECDEIWHAGDIGNIDTANSLTEFKPVKGVYGNADGNLLRVHFPKHQRFYM